MSSFGGVGGALEATREAVRRRCERPGASLVTQEGHRVPPTQSRGHGEGVAGAPSAQIPLKTSQILPNPRFWGAFWQIAKR